MLLNCHKIEKQGISVCVFNSSFNFNNTGCKLLLLLHEVNMKHTHILINKLANFDMQSTNNFYVILKHLQYQLEGLGSF